MSDEYLSALRGSQQEEELLGIVHKLGYKEYKEGEDYYIKSKTAEIRLDARTFKELEKNPSYISTLDNDQIKIASLLKQTVPHSQTLDKYLSQYRVQRNKMSIASLNAWRNATGNAQKLLNQVNKLSEKYDGNYSFTLLNKANTLDVFLDNLNASKGGLGM